MKNAVSTKCDHKFCKWVKSKRGIEVKFRYRNCLGFHHCRIQHLQKQNSKKNEWMKSSPGQTRFSLISGIVLRLLWVKAQQHSVRCATSHSQRGTVLNLFVSFLHWSTCVIIWLQNFDQFLGKEQRSIPPNVCEAYTFRVSHPQGSQKR